MAARAAAPGHGAESTQEVFPVSKVAPYYSISPEDPEVYHDKDRCPSGEQIKPENKRYGTDGRQHCKQCPDVD